jgi:hypothetical protein
MILTIGSGIISSVRELLEKFLALWQICSPLAQRIRAPWPVAQARNLWEKNKIIPM